MTASQVILRNYPEDIREEPGYIGVLTGKKEIVVKHQKIAANLKKPPDIYGKMQESELSEIIP